MKKNYNYAYGNLLESWTSNIKVLGDYGFNTEVQKLGEFNFTSPCLKRLKSVIEQFEEVRIDEPELKYDEEKDAALQLHEYQLSILLARDSSNEQAQSSSEIQRKVASHALTRTRQDFEFVYKDVKSELTSMCMQNNIEGFIGFLSESPWAAGTLVETGLGLSIKLLEQNNFEMLNLIFKYDASISEYKLEVLKLALFQKNSDAVKFLVMDKYSQEEVSSILGSKEYYSSSQEVVSELTEFLSGSQDELSAKSYGGMFLYSNSRYEDAIALFEEVIDKGVGRQKQVAQFYKGLCLQYSGDKANAISAFQLIMEGDIDEYYDSTSSIKNHAQEHLNSLNRIVERQESVAGLKKVWEENNNDFLLKHKESLTSALQHLSDHMNAPKDLTMYVKEVISTLSRIKFISLKQDAPKEIVSAEEFHDLPELYSQMLGSIDRKILHVYNTAVKEIDNTISLVGQITDGLIIDDTL